MNRKLFVVLASVSVIFTVRTAARLDHNKVHDRYRRGITKGQCQDLMVKNSNCTKSVNWDLREMLVSSNCNATCMERNFCQKRCLNDGINENTCDKSSSEFKKFVLLQLLCSKKGGGLPCIRTLYNAYHNAANDSQILHHLSTASGRCCIASLMMVYNSSGNVSELLPSSWKKVGLPVPLDCHLKTLESSTVMPSTHKVSKQSASTSISSVAEQTKTPTKSSSTFSQASKTTTKAQEPDRSNSSTKLSSRLKASLIIASIIFIVVAVIVGRYIYHRIQRKKRAKYEDYGYSQLKVILEDDLYEDEEDDDPLLSAI